MPASRADLLRPRPSLTDVRNRTPAADEELRCMSNHLVDKALLRPIEPGVPEADEPEAVEIRAQLTLSPGTLACRRSCGPDRGPAAQQVRLPRCSPRWWVSTTSFEW